MTPRIQLLQSSPRPKMLRRGDRLAHHEIIELIASGGFGDVYRGVDRSLDRPVAIKVLRAQHLNDPGLRARFVREAQLLAQVKNEHIVQVFFAEQQDDIAYMVMELVGGITLGAHMAAEEPLPISDALLITAKIANGVAAAHDAGIIHRDLKPDNVLITPDFGISVGDFGTARVLSDAQSEKLIGTLAYMSPEHFESKVQLDERTDIRAIGLMLYLMLSGKQAYTRPPDMSLPEFMLRVASELPPDPKRYARYLAAYDYVLRIVWKAIHQDRTCRHATAHELEAECLEAKARLHREASPDRAERLAQLDARAPYLVSDTAPMLGFRTQTALPPAQEAKLVPAPARQSAPAPARRPLARSARLAIATSAVMLSVAFYILKLFSGEGAAPSASQARLALRHDTSVQNTVTASTLPPPLVPSAALPGPLFATSAPPRASEPPIEQRAVLSPIQRSPPARNERPNAGLTEATRHPHPLFDRKGAPTAAHGLTVPPPGSPTSIADGCDRSKYRCSIF